MFYANNLDKIKPVIDSFNLEEARSIEEAQEPCDKDSIKADLSFIKAHLSFLPNSIQHLEIAGLTLAEALAVVEDADQRIGLIPGPKGAFFKAKMNSVLKKNSALKLMQQVNDVLQGDENSTVPQNMSPEDLTNLKYCPLSSVDVERSFSIFKLLFSNRRHSFSEENLRQSLIVNCFYSRNE